VSLRVVVEADGGSRGNPGPAGYGACVLDPATGTTLAERAAGIGTATNNVAEYGGLIAGLTAAAELGATLVDVRMDSKLVVEQMSGRWKVKHPAMQPLAREAAGLVRQFEKVTFQWIPREQNKHADRLANEAMDAAAKGLEWQAPAAAPEEPAVGSGWSAPTTVPTTTWLLRHGQTPLSVEKRFSGVGADPELTEVGLAQAAAAAERLRAVAPDIIVASPLRRTRQTAEAVAAATGAEVVVDDGFRETDFGDWDGYTFTEIRERWPAELGAWVSNTSVAPPHGESFDETSLRVRKARDRLLQSYGGKTVVVVSHVTPIKTLVRLALDAPPQALYRMHLDLACLSEVAWFADGPAVLRSFNDTAHLADG
jgi:probable phosphoglycerate mutase